MEDWHKMAFALIAFALVVTWYCKNKKEHMHTAMPQVTAAAMPVMNAVTATQPAGGLQPVETDSMDYAPFPGDMAPCTLKQAYAA